MEQGDTVDFHICMEDPYLPPHNVGPTVRMDIVITVVYCKLHLRIPLLMFSRVV